ncbi:MAG: UvrD-helicase domain-containing protein, partial [Anaerolineae bacterium]|nr:UvrD-helicase domain-containing protein [Anaerolineae bacterium]
MKETAAQHTAIHEQSRNLIVVAGAGSGKTYVLVERYLALLDTHTEWPLNALVAITFTKKAAQEMRDRVRQALEERYDKASNASDRDLWAGRIAAMQSARIDTIHGLCASILRANAAEAGIDPGFEVLDEIQAASLRDDVIDSTLAAVANERGELVRLLVEYETFTVRRALTDLMSVNLDTSQRDGDLLAAWRAEWELAATARITALCANEFYREASDWLPPNGWPEGDDKLLAVWRGCWDALATVDDTAQSLETRVAAMQTLAATIKLTGGSAKTWGDKDTVDESKAMLRVIRESVNDALNDIGEAPGALDARTADLLPLWATLIGRAQTAYWQAKQDLRALDFDDLERLTQQVLLNDAVRARYQGDEFKHLLVDEFQDTNAAQWAIVQRLADLTHGGSLFVVGDPKQSIYQFRGADVSVFDAVRGQILQAGGMDVALARSFRTHQGLVAAFNDLFRFILARDPASPVYAYEVELGTPMEAERGERPSDAPPIEMILIDRAVLEDEESDAESRRRWEAYEVARRLRVMVEDEQRPIYDKNLRQMRPIGYGDIAVLFQSMSSITIYEDVFKAVGLPFVTVAGRGYYSKQEVWDVLNLLSALHNTGDDLALATALRSPLFGLSDDALLALRLLRDEQGKRLPLWNALANTTGVPAGEIELVNYARECLTALRERAGRVTIAELLREALDRTGYLATLSGLPDGTRRRGNVEKLVSKAESSGQVTFGAFTQYLRDLSDREVREGEALVDVKDAATLMTVHASKGLEFPLVALVDVGWSRRSGDSPPVMFDAAHGLTCRIYDPDAEKLVSGYAHTRAERLLELRLRAERKRLLYVAMTRAQDYLLLSGQVPRTKDGAWKTQTWLGWLWEALELGTTEFPAGSTPLPYQWGQLVVTIPAQMPPEEALALREDDGGALWEHPAVQSGQPLPDSGAPQEPDLMRPIRIRRTASARHLTATQIADLGSARHLANVGQSESAFYRRKFLGSVLHDAPDRIEQISAREQRATVSQRIIGEIVHQVLGIWRFPSQDNDLEKTLQSYAWGLGIVHPGQQKYAVQEARALLNRMQGSDVYEWLQAALQVHRELPFVFRSDERIIHGVLDVLFQRADGSWGIIDYKTSYVEGFHATKDANLVRQHARRYYLQVGVYAAAVREQLGLTPDVY